MSRSSLPSPRSITVSIQMPIEEGLMSVSDAYPVSEGGTHRHLALKAADVRLLMSDRGFRRLLARVLAQDPEVPG